MTAFQLNQGVYVTPTPAGAYYCVASEEDSPSRRLLNTLLTKKETPLISPQELRQWNDFESEEKALELLYHTQSLGWIEGLDAQQHAPPGTLETTLPSLLSQLSGAGKALLADSQGFYICSEGFPHESAEELSALSADIASLQLRHQRLLQNNLGLGTSAWSLVDAAGNSQLGFWPMFIGDQRFVLVISGIPHLNKPAFTRLVWSLCKRYGTT